MSTPDDQSRRASNARSGREPAWPSELASLGGIRFARAYYHYEEAVHFFRDLVGLPLYEAVSLLSGEGYPIRFGWLNAV